MLRRKIDKIFDNWAINNKKKALLVEGARQVGKTTSIRELARRHYKHFIEINFIKTPSVKKAFDGDLDANTIILSDQNSELTMIDLKKRLSLLVGLFLAALFGSAQVLLNGGYGIDIADSSLLQFQTIIDGKTVEVPLKYYVNRDEWSTVVYEWSDPFTEHDTDYLCRQFFIFRNLGETDTCVRNYFIRSRTRNDHTEYALKMTPKQSVLESEDPPGEEFCSRKYRKLLHQPLDSTLFRNVPRLWFPIMRYRGRYFFSEDNPYVTELTDSAVIFYGMEPVLLPYLDVHFTNDLYYYEIPAYHDGLFKTWITPSNKVPGLFVMTTKSSEGHIQHQLVTPSENLHLFDLINIRNWCEITDGLPYDTVDYSEYVDELMPDVIVSEQMRRNRIVEIEDNHLPEESGHLFYSDTIICETIIDVDFSDTEEDDSWRENVFRFAEEMPEFPGGPDAMDAYVKRSVQYPEVARSNGIHGTVLVEFVVETDGSLSHPVIKVPLFPECDQEAVRVVMSMPKWSPARMQGKPIRCYYVVPVKFVL